MMKTPKKITLTFVLTTFILCSCQKDIFVENILSPSDLNPGNTNATNSGSGSSGGALVATLNYGDTLFYLHPSGNNIISPIKFTLQGKFYGFPSGIELDSLNGNIDLAESETGLRYKIMFVPAGSTDTIKTRIVISGLNFYDGIYNLSKGDSIAHAIYNANGKPYNRGLFGTGNSCVFDEGNGCNSKGCAVSLVNGEINLAKSLRSGAVLRKNDSQEEFAYYYRMDDPSDKALNRLKVKLYFYNTVADIPQYLWDIILNDHAGTIVEAAPASGFRRVAKPRPPCLIIVLN